MVQMSSAAMAQSVRSDFRLRQSFAAILSSISNHLQAASCLSGSRSRKRDPYSEHCETHRLFGQHPGEISGDVSEFRDALPEVRTGHVDRLTLCIVCKVHVH